MSDLPAAEQKNLRPWHSAVQVRVPKPGVSSEIAMSSSGHPTCPALAAARPMQPPSITTTARRKTDFN
jgi:hypothetical protein